MASQITVFSKINKSGKSYGYRFEIAPVDGKRKWCTKKGFKTKAEALQKGKQAQLEYETKGVVVNKSEISYSDFLDMWLNSLVGILKQSTIDNYEKKTRLYIKPYLGGKRLCNINKDDIKNLMVSLSENGRKDSDLGLADNTLSVIKGMIQKSFNYAIENSMLPNSPITGKFPMPRKESYVVQSKNKENPHVYIPEERMKQIFERFPEGSSAYIPLLIGYRCGLRIGEVYALTWDDINFETKTLTIRRQVQWYSNKNKSRNSPSKRIETGKDSNYGYWFFTNPKYNSCRTIGIDDTLLEILKKQKDKQEKAKAYYDEHYFNYYEDENGRITRKETDTILNFINVRESGEYINPRTMQHTSQVIHNQLEYPEFDFHSLRHTHATMLAENGASPQFIQNRLGHKNLSVTLNTYFHFTNKMEKDGCDILDKMYL